MATETQHFHNTGHTASSNRHPACQFQADKRWLDLEFHEDGTVKRPDELQQEMKDPPADIDRKIFDRIHGSMLGMALGDALGAFVEFRPHEYLQEHPVTNLQGGGTWGLKKGQFTDDTSMGLCLANSLIARKAYVPYDQLVRYKWWHQHGYMSSTGQCFDIGAATRKSLVEFESRQKKFADQYNIPFNQIDFLSDPELLNRFDANCSSEGVAGNGALMRLAPVPLFFYRDPIYAIKCSGHSGEITHGDEKAYDACRYYGALIVAALQGKDRKELLDNDFYSNNKQWFDGKDLHPDILEIARGSYKRGGYEKGIRGKGYIVNALEAALWAFWSEEDSFKKGALAAVNLGDDTDTTAAIYGQLAGAYYGYSKLRRDWVEEMYAKDYIECLSKWIVYEGENWATKREVSSNVTPMRIESPSKPSHTGFFGQKIKSGKQPETQQGRRRSSLTLENNEMAQMNAIAEAQKADEPKSSFRPRRYTVCDTVFDVNSSQHQQHGYETSNSEQKQKSTVPSEKIYHLKGFKDTEHVCKWSRSLDNGCATYEDLFRQHDVNGYWLLNHVNDKILRQYGIENKDHRLYILHEIEELKKQCP